MFFITEFRRCNAKFQRKFDENRSAEEALLKRSCHFDLEESNKKDSDTALQACQIIVQYREKQLKDCETEVTEKLKEVSRTIQIFIYFSMKFLRKFREISIDEFITKNCLHKIEIHEK